jgi:DNA-directed RNA polymerase subunit beta'
MDQLPEDHHRLDDDDEDKFVVKDGSRSHWGSPDEYRARQAAYKFAKVKNETSQMQEKEIPEASSGN